MSDTEYALAFSFEDKSASYVYGYEAGQIGESMKRRDLDISATVREENYITLLEMAKYYRYSIHIENTESDGWMNLDAKLINKDKSFSDQ